MKLYYAPGACSLATHILLREAGQQFDLEKVDIRKKTTEHGEDWLSLNPKGYVPALRMDDGDILTENVVLHGYIADMKPELKLAPAHGTKARLKQDELAVYVSTEIHKSYGPLFNPAITDDARKAAIDRLHTRYKLIEQLLHFGSDVFRCGINDLFLVGFPPDLHRPRGFATAAYGFCNGTVTDHDGAHGAGVGDVGRATR